MENGIYVNTLCVCVCVCVCVCLCVCVCVCRLAGILLARSSIRSFIYRLGYLILLLNNLRYSYRDQKLKSNIFVVCQIRHASLHSKGI